MEKSRMATKKELQLLKDYAKMNVTGGNMTNEEKELIKDFEQFIKDNK